jgi:cystathionine beta-lyase/cystathionine gamma-synthase
MAAIHASLLARGVKAGASIVAALDLYGATFTLLRGLLNSLGVNIRMVNVSDLEEVEAALKETRSVALLVETISNPLLKVADVPPLATLAHRYGASLLVDNTFASPYLFNPLKHGADYAIHSATKYLAGHGDVLAGVVATSAENKSKLFELNKLVGSVLGPFEAWLALRGLKTYAECVSNAITRSGSRNCSSQPRSKVNYPGLIDHPQHDLVERLFEGKEWRCAHLRSGRG